MTYTPGKHNDFLDIAEEPNTKTIKKWNDIIEEYYIKSSK